MASELQVDELKGVTADGDITITDGAVTYKMQDGLAKAYVNLTGTGTIANNKSLNVTSVTDNATGDYTFTWSSSFNDADYAFAGMCRATTNNEADDDLRVVMAGATQTSSLRVGTTYNNGSGGYDVPRVCTLITGDLA